MKHFIFYLIIYSSSVIKYITHFAEPELLEVNERIYERYGV